MLNNNNSIKWKKINEDRITNATGKCESDIDFLHLLGGWVAYWSHLLIRK